MTINEAQENTDIAFFNMLMQYPYYKRLFYLMSDGVHIEKLLFKTKDWMKRTIAFPPLPEQKKIAEILTAQDSVISLLQKRIELKQQQKKALMQKLLSGEVRVGSGEWKKYEFELIFNKLNAPAKLKTKDYLEIGSIPIVDQSKKRIVGYTDDSSLKVACPSSGLIVFGDHTREVKYIRFDFAVGADGTQLIYSQAHNTKFLYYYLLNTTLPNDGYSRHFKYIKEMVFHLPPLPEQEKIAEILSAQDREIELMQQQLALEQQKKKALMQLLLTGKVRVKT